MQEELILGDLSAQVDWGYAYDYIKAMHKILNLSNPDDFVIATKEKHSVLDFVKIVFNYLDLDWKKYVKEEKSILTRKRTPMVGDYKKINKASGWKPETDFKKMIEIIIDKLNQ